MGIESDQSIKRFIKNEDAFVSFTGLLDPIESKISYSELSYVQET
ncbi:hypothetical protein LEP1GSC133_4416 [Leptospira borgpetersenii serovar Pomona str. 200901868]|uniref:Uncharacterized protein n=1 Tax=Leptospira borgpetersenii serovar Pomona str. 200901868 TaxID=1192866 RepID=M6VT88_LEPBO|nr:hypothetical protein LEP1GSC133_4416 [Leptospira borgpetersenii serovar Pomona str. 200901868]